MQSECIAKLCEWFDGNARDLPWRKKRNGYTALVAEMMLQQTQVSRVIDRYVMFLKQFPTVRSLARADEQDLLMVWQGLGYYRRARNLLAAAKVIMNQFGGRVPQTVSELMQLPGVGRYTAGAIASIVFGKPEPIVDGNVQRVLARWFAKRHAPNTKTASAWTWRTASDLANAASQPGKFNEALMELGSLICTPNSPKCDRCPVAKSCEAHRRQLQHVIPSPKIRAAPQTLHHHAVVITRNGRVLVEQRSNTGMWSRMWQTPTIERHQRMSLTEVKNTLQITVTDLAHCGGFDHRTTHRAIRFHLYRGQSRTRKGIWKRINDLDRLPMSNAQKKVFAILAVPTHESQAASS